MNAQGTQSLRRVTVTSVTLRFDSVNTASEAVSVRNLITAHAEVNNFDIKLNKCNFTFTQQAFAINDFLAELEAAGYRATVKDLQPQQTFSYVPEENCMAKENAAADLKEADFVRSFREKEPARKPIRED